MNENIKKIETAQEISIVVNLAKKIWTNHYTDIIGEKQVSYMIDKYQSFEAIKNQIEKDNYVYYGIYLESELTGYLSIKFEEEAIFLSKFYIDSSYRGKGLGRIAIIFIENLCRLMNKKRIYLTVNKNNSSVEIYKKLGFKISKALVTDIGNNFVMDDYMLEKLVMQD